jgi:hypothetical protein
MDIEKSLSRFSVPLRLKPLNPGALGVLLRHPGDPNVMDLVVRIRKHDRVPLMS